MTNCSDDCGECWYCQSSTEFFLVKWMYSFIGKDGLLYEDVVVRTATPRMLATMFKDPHLAFIQVNGVLYGHDYMGGFWRNNYCGQMEEYYTPSTEAQRHRWDPLAEFGDEIPF